MKSHQGLPIFLFSYLITDVKFKQPNFPYFLSKGNGSGSGWAENQLVYAIGPPEAEIVEMTLVVSRFHFLRVGSCI